MGPCANSSIVGAFLVILARSYSPPRSGLTPGFPLPSARLLATILARESGRDGWPFCKQDGNMENAEWVKAQFGLPKKRRSGWRYRDVLLLTSFIESVVRDAAAPDEPHRKEFKPSLKTLGLRIENEEEDGASYGQDCRHREDCLIEINTLRIQRNRLLHDIIRDHLPEERINATIKRMAKNIRHVCTESRLIREYFRTEYGFDPAELI